MVKRTRKDVTHFCGWPTLEKLVQKAETTEAKGLIATLFETGCRVSETLELKKSMFRVKDDFIMGYGIPVKKKRDRASRTLAISLEDPLAPVMLEYLDECENELFPGKYRMWVWREINQVDPSWWPHRFRVERATQLVIEHHFNVSHLQRWFSWTGVREPIEYVKLRIDDLQDLMRTRH